ncbi:hypothetical protein HPB50_024981 [Hyalomma asiaticum]|uniref:Uncharacterized protein n=1 Tax=Hyalomma asiaticum TaxID=266040 RepID=A0ACB7TNA3_HYAAI|nr:hypothetical protein HPB50_024981 [Hyalomma asiaticum]
MTANHAEICRFANEATPSEERNDRTVWAPYGLAEEERISPVLSGIDDSTWANPLAAQLCVSVTEHIDRAALLTQDAKQKQAPRTTRCHRDQQRNVSKVQLDVRRPATATLTSCRLSIHAAWRKKNVTQWRSANCASTSHIRKTVLQ